MNNEIGIYIHIPFCLKKCHYCDFISYVNKENMVGEYVNALCNEILSYSEILTNYSITTIYIGGGTPSFIDSKYIRQILDTIMLFVDKEKLAEVTIEVNPNSASLDKLKDYVASGVNRLSIGLQSSHEDVLKVIGRQHNLKDFENTLDNAKLAGIDNISVDLMYPLPNLDLNRFKESVDYVISLKDKNVKHVSIYNLEIHENTKLAFLLQEGYVTLVDEDEEYDMYNYLKDTLEENGYHRYEISNYCIPSYESKHNTRYWNQDQYLGFGVNAASFFNGTRYKNETSLEKYISDVNNGISTVIEKEEQDLLSLMKENIILALRLTQGLNMDNFKARYKKSIFDLFKSEIDTLKSEGLIEIENEYIRLTQRGLEVANIVWERFI